MYYSSSYTGKGKRKEGKGGDRVLWSLQYKEKKK